MYLKVIDLYKSELYAHLGKYTQNGYAKFNQVGVPHTV